MTPELAALLGCLGGLAIAVLVVLWLHERREFARQDRHELAAQAREAAASERHDALMKALADNRAMTLAAVNQRNRLEARTSALEAAINDHAEHLAALGRSRPARVRTGLEPLDPTL